jgi:hypothetical protein
MQFATEVRAADASPTQRAAMLRLPTLIADSTAGDGHPPPAAPVLPTECQAALTTTVLRAYRLAAAEGIGCLARRRAQTLLCEV